MKSKTRNIKGRLGLAVFLIAFLLGNQMTYGQSGYYGSMTFYIWHIAKNVEWPADYKSGDFIIGVLGKSDATQQFKMMAMKRDLGGRSIKVAEYSTVDEIAKCNMLFVSKNFSGQLSDVLKKINGASIMTLTEEEGLALKGSCANFIPQGARVAGVEMNRAAMDKAGLKASKELAKWMVVP